MKYRDQNLQVSGEFIAVVDKDRPAQALIDLFNPPSNLLGAQSQSLVIRATGILHELNEDICFGISDTSLHCLMPIVIYSRSVNEDKYFSLSNNLVIQDHMLARDLLESVNVSFYKESKKLTDAIFSQQNFIYLVFNIDDLEAIFTSIDRIIERRGVISIHNPSYKNTTPIMKYCLDRQIMLIENIDGSADVFKF